jgi:hypothetical protein
MTDQHRATPEQLSMSVYPGDLATDPRKVAVVINALSDRIEALEAAQLAHRIQSGTLTSAERAELGVVPVANMEAAARRAAAEARDAVMATLSHLSDAEREQAAQDLASPAAWRPLEVETTYGSGDAQRIAQELLKPRAMVVRGSFEHGGKQFSYEAEAMEAERPPHQDKLDRLIALDAADPTPDPTTPEPRAASAEARPAASEIFPVEYADSNGEGIRIIMEPADETGRVCWVVRNSRRVNPIHEFPTPEAAYAAHQARAEDEADRG